MRGTAILRDLRRLSHLPLRHETIYHLALTPGGPEPPTLNRLIAADPALALAALRITPRPFRENWPGIPQIARFVSGQAILELLKDQRSASWGDRGSAVLDRVWTHSIGMAHAVRQMSRGRGYNHSQSAFLAGLLHNVGLVAMAVIDPDAVQEILTTERVSDCLAKERSQFGTTHLTLGGQLAKRWALPTWLTGAIRWHHQPPRALPAGLTDPALVELVREADAALGAGEFLLGSNGDLSIAERVVKRSDPLRYCVVAGIRQATALLDGHPLRDMAQNSDKWVERVVDLATQNATLQSELGWRCRAWEEFGRLTPDAGAADLTPLIAATFHDALGALGVLCYVRNTDGSAAEGTFYCEGSRPVSCAIERGGSKLHSEQVVGQLRATWQRRPYRVIDIECSEEAVAHVLVWIDEFASAPSDQAVDDVRSLCASWLAKVIHVSDLETQVESLEETIRNQVAETASQLERAKLDGLAEMAAGAGHEFNNPLAVISGRAQLLLTEETDPRRRKSLETIIGQAQRVHRMIVDLMFFARPPVPDCKPVSVAEVVERALAAVARDAERLKVTLVANIQPDLPAIDADIAQLAAALECILQNGLEATPENGNVQLSAEAVERGTVQFKISDTGHGITEEQRQHIFEPFYCGREAGRGLGMGLPKAWSILKNHNGEIVIPSMPPGNGTTVIVRLPALAADSTQRACA